MKRRQRNAAAVHCARLETFGIVADSVLSDADFNLGTSRRAKAITGDDSTNITDSTDITDVTDVTDNGNSGNGIISRPGRNSNPTLAPSPDFALNLSPNPNPNPNLDPDPNEDSSLDFAVQSNRVVWIGRTDSETSPIRQGLQEKTEVISAEDLSLDADRKKKRRPRQERKKVVVVDAGPPEDSKRRRKYKAQKEEMMKKAIPIVKVEALNTPLKRKARKAKEQLFFGRIQYILTEEDKEESQKEQFSVFINGRVIEDPIRMVADLKGYAYLLKNLTEFTRSVIICGRTGTSKTATAKAVIMRKKWVIRDATWLEVPYTAKYDAYFRKLSQILSVRQRSINKKIAVLLKVPKWTSTLKARYGEIIQKLSSDMILFFVSDDLPFNHVSPFAICVRLTRPDTGEMERRLTQFALYEGLEVDPKLIEKIAGTSRGNFSSAVNNLLFYSTPEIPQIEQDPEVTGTHRYLNSSSDSDYVFDTDEEVHSDPSFNSNPDLRFSLDPDLELDEDPDADLQEIIEPQLRNQIKKRREEQRRMKAKIEEERRKEADKQSVGGVDLFERELSLEDMADPAIGYDAKMTNIRLDSYFYGKGAEDKALHANFDKSSEQVVRALDWISEADTVPPSSEDTRSVLSVLLPMKELRETEEAPPSGSPYWRDPLRKPDFIIGPFDDDDSIMMLGRFASKEEKRELAFMPRLVGAKRRLSIKDKDMNQRRKFFREGISSIRKH